MGRVLVAQALEVQEHGGGIDEICAALCVDRERSTKGHVPQDKPLLGKNRSCGYADCSG